MLCSTHRRLRCVVSVLVAGLLCSLRGDHLPPLYADETEPAAGDKAARAESLKLMRAKAEQIIVRLGAGDDAQACELKETPLIHYSDQVRRLPESTLWVWQRAGLPVLFCKVERITDAAGATKSWQY